VSSPEQRSPSSGRFAYERWWLEVGDDDRAAEYASAHESHHKQLSDSTAFGVLARLVSELGEKNAELAHGLMRAAEPVQEAFACWAPLMALRWTPTELADVYPAYVRHWRAMEDVVGQVAAPYVRFHAAHAVARVCMQAPVDEIVTAVGFERLRLADISRWERPDQRFAQLRRAPPAWPSLLQRLEQHFAKDDRFQFVVDADELTAALFAVDLRELWTRVNCAVYDVLVGHLAAMGFRTLAYDGLPAANARLIAAAAHVDGGKKLGIAPRERVRSEESPRIVIANIESEDFSVGPPLSARLVDQTAPPEALVADLEYPHLFLTLRRNDALLANYALDRGANPTGVGAYLRRSVNEADGTTRVELRAVDGPEQLAEVGVPVFAAVPLSLLTREARELWGEYLDVRHAAAIVDVALGPLLELWLAHPGSRFRYAFIRTEPAGRVLPMLLAVVDAAGIQTTHLVVKPMSPPAIRKLKAAFDELDPDGRQLAADPSLVEDFEPLAQIVLAHIALEEVRFSLTGI